MFNIYKKIYVTTTKEVDLIHNRVIVLHDQFKDVVFDQLASPHDITQQGLIYNSPMFEKLLQDYFSNDLSNFYNWLNTQEKLKIACSQSQYMKLLCYILLELQTTFNITDNHIRYILDNHKFNQFLHNHGELLDLKGTMQYIRKQYKICGNLYTKNDVSILPFEIVYALYKWKYITKTAANKKIKIIAPLLLQGQLQDLFESVKVAISKSPIVLQKFCKNPKIKTIDQRIKAINNNPILTKALLKNSKFDLTNKQELDSVVELSHIVIDNDLDFDLQPETEKAELQFFYDLYTTCDITIIEKAKYNFLSTGFIQSKSSKFDSSLIINT